MPSTTVRPNAADQDTNWSDDYDTALRNSYAAQSASQAPASAFRRVAAQFEKLADTAPTEQQKADAERHEEALHDIADTIDEVTLGKVWRTLDPYISPTGFRWEDHEARSIPNVGNHPDLRVEWLDPYQFTIVGYWSGKNGTATVRKIELTAMVDVNQLWVHAGTVTGPARGRQASYNSAADYVTAQLNAALNS